MRVYVAAPWVERDRARELADILGRQGHVVTQRWWDHRDVPGYRTGCETPEEMAELQEQAYLDLDGVVSADVFVLINSSMSEGKAVETGVALTAGMPIIVLGSRTNLFHYCEMVELVENEDQLLMALDNIEAAWTTEGVDNEHDYFQEMR